MKRVLTFAFLAAFIAFSGCVQAQGSPTDTPEQRLHRASLPSLMTQTLANGTVISIDYSQPALKGRVIGTTIEPMAGKVWRTGANEATSFEVSKDVIVEGKKLPAGKYGLYMISGNEWTIIFNKTWKAWGAYDYKEADDVLRIKVKPGQFPLNMERMVFNVDKAGKVSLLWGNTEIDFHVE